MARKPKPPPPPPPPVVAPNDWGRTVDSPTIFLSWGGVNELVSLHLDWSTTTSTI